MGTFRLLGLNIDEQRSQLREPGGERFTVREWQGNIDSHAGVANISAWLEIAGRYTLLLDLSLRVEGSSGVWQVQDGPHLQKSDARFCLLPKIYPRRPTTGPALEVALGPITQQNVRFPGNAVHGVAGELQLHPRSSSLITAAELPVAIEPDDIRFSVDLSVAEIRYFSRSFRLEAAARTRIYDAKKRRSRPEKFFVSQHRSRELVVPLTRQSDTQSIVFDADPGALLVLHVFPGARDTEPTAEQPLIAPLGVTQHALRATLAGTRKTGVDLAALTVLPGTTQLHVFSLADQLNQPMVYRLQDECELHMRVGLKSRPATLLVAPNYAVTGNDSGSVRLAPAGTDDGDTDLHGHVASTRFSPRGAGQLVCEPDRVVTHEGKIPPGVVRTIVSETTFPWVRFAPGSQQFSHPRPGNAYLPSGGLDTRVAAMRFAEGELALALLPEHFCQTEIERSHGAALIRDHNARLATNRYALPETTHESGLLERPPSDEEVRLHVRRLYSLPEDTINRSVNEPDHVLLDDYQLVRDYGPIQVQMKVPGGHVPDYVLFEGGNADGTFVAGSNFKLTLSQQPLFRCADQPELETHALPPGVRHRPLAILKLNQNLGLRDIFEREQLDRSVPGYTHLDFVEHVLDVTTKSRLWVGLVLFNLPFDYTNVAILNDILPRNLSGGPRLGYMAISPKKRDGRNLDANSISARVVWRNAEPAPVLTAASPREEEARFRVDELDIRWYDNALVQFRAAARVVFHRILGADRPPVEMAIAGSYDEESQAIVFRGQLAEPLNLVPETWSYGPFAKLLVASADIRNVAGATAVDLRGSLVWRSFGSADSEWFQCAPDFATAYTTLTVDFPSPLPQGSSWVPLRINYPNIRLPANAVVYQLGFMNLTIHELGVDWDGTVDWDRYLQLYGPDNAWPDDGYAYLRCRLELMKLPELSGGPIDSLVLDFTYGFDTDVNAGPERAWDASRARFRVKGVGIERMRLALLRFLVAEAGKIAIETQSMTVAGEEVDVDWLVLEDISVTVLGQALIEKFSLYVYSMPDGRRGVLGLLAPGSLNLPDEPDEPESDEEREKNRAAQTNGVTRPRRKKKKRRARKAAAKGLRGANGFLQMIEWALVGQNISIDRELAQNLVSLDADAASVGEALGTAFANDALVPQTAGDATGDWIFAAGVDVEELFSGKFLFQEGAYYGLALKSPLFEKYFSLDLAISVLYIVGDQPDEDTFIVSVRVPEVVAPALTFLGGTVTLEVVLNGSFYLDVGFPHLGDNDVRDWDRAFGIILTPFIGSAGAYIRYRRMQLSTTTLPTADLMVLSIGYAAQIGIAGSYGGGVFQVTASAGIYYALQGDLVLQEKEIRGLRIVGAVGLIVQASAELNWWIVSARIDIALVAEARATLTWAQRDLQLPEALPEDSLVPFFTALRKASKGDSDNAVLSIDMVVYAEATAEACIGSGIFKICASFSVSIPLRYSYDFDL